MPQPKLNDLLARFLQNQTSAQAVGLGLAPEGEVLPYDASSLQPVDPQAAWSAATAAIAFYDPHTNASPAPAQWAQLVAAHEPEVAVPFCLGNFPQLMRNFQSILHNAKLDELRPRSSRPSNQPALVEWANEIARREDIGEALLAAACLRLANEAAAAAKILNGLQKAAPDAWRPAVENEQAALAWHQGRADEARKAWNKQSASVPVLFNRGMATMFAGRQKDAVAPLTSAVAQLPETNPWHHLGRLYLVLAQDHGLEHS